MTSPQGIPNSTSTSTEVAAAPATPSAAYSGVRERHEIPDLSDSSAAGPSGSRGSSAIQKVHVPPAPERPPERVVVTVTGKDRPGIVSEIVSAVADAGVELLDIQQTAVRGRLSLAVQLEVGRDAESQRVFRDLVVVGKRLNVRVDFDIPGEESVGDGSRGTVMPYVLTLLSSKSISLEFLESLSDLLRENNVELLKATTLSENSLRSLELIVSPIDSVNVGDMAEFRTSLYSFGRKHAIDIALQAESIFRRNKRLVVMDMDSTLIQQEIIDELARHAGKYEAVKEITHRAMGGGMDFNESLLQRVALLQGTPASALDKVIANLKYTAGAHYLCRSLKKLGYRLAVISGGFTSVTQHVRRELDLDYDYANQLEVGEDGCFTGRTVGPIVNAQRKADLLMTIAQQEHITLDQVIAIGDGANDLPMLSVAGLGIAFNAKQVVQEAASFRINQPNLDAVLYLLGFSDADQHELSGRKRSKYPGAERDRNPHLGKGGSYIN